MKFTGKKIILYLSLTFGVVTLLSYSLLHFSHGRFGSSNWIIGFLLSILITAISTVVIDFIAYHTIRKSFLFDFSKLQYNQDFELPTEEPFPRTPLPEDFIKPEEYDWYNDATNPASPLYQATHRRTDQLI